MDAEKSYLENQSFIEACARKLCGTFHCEHLLEDLISVGTLAFLEHFPDYDETAGAKLTTYLYPFINGDMRREIEASLGPLHIPKRAFEREGAPAGFSLEELWESEQLAGKKIEPRLMQKAEPVQKAATNKVILDAIGVEFQTLSFKEREILGGRLGLFGYPKRTLAYLAEEFQLTEDGVFKAYRRAMEKLRSRCLKGRPQEIREAVRAVMKETE